MTDGWKAYYPDGGETAEDARTVTPRVWRQIYDAEDAACIACEHDYAARDGWERTMGESFGIVVIAPDGAETRWNAVHEATVTHSVEEAEGETE